MASVAPITGAPIGASDKFEINGTRPFQDETGAEYIRAAHAVACLGAANGSDNHDFYSTTPIVRAGFDAIALLLAHAELLAEKRA